MRDSVVDFITRLHELTEIRRVQLLTWLSLSPRKYLRWLGRYGKANEHNGKIPATTGSPRRNARPSSPSPAPIPSKATAASPS